eukprot:SAG31_NODE_742_length_12424_cov_16.082353_3_plen_82_part_00
MVRADLNKSFSFLLVIPTCQIQGDVGPDTEYSKVPGAAASTADRPTNVLGIWSERADGKIATRDARIEFSSSFGRSVGTRA